MDKKSLRSVVESQKGEVAALLGRPHIIRRECLPHMEKFMASDLVKVLKGVRRCGKSTLALQLVSGRKYAYVNLDDERLFRLSSKDLDSLLEILYEVYGAFDSLLLDEIQNVPCWELFVSRLSRKGVNVVVTGSNARLLSRELATHLTGRHVAFELYPFSFREFLSVKGESFKTGELHTSEGAGRAKALLSEYISTGGFPEVYTGVDSVRYLRELYKSIVARDIVGRHGVRNVNALMDTVSYLVSNFSATVSFPKIKNLFGFGSVHTVKNYLSYAEESYLVSSVLAFSHKLKEQIRMPRKIYVVDTGLALALGLHSSGGRGRIIENLVAVELFRRRSLDPLLGMHFFRDYAGREVDFVLKDASGVRQLIQVSLDVSAQTVADRETRSLLKAAEETSCDDLLIITWDYEGEIKKGARTIVLTPLWKWLMSP